MKAVGADIHHKTEGGLVVLGITAGPQAAAETYRLLEERAGDALEGVLVERMIAGNRELLVGLKRDPVFGPVVAFGLGGVLTEVLGDIALALVPPSERDVAELLDSIRSQPDPGRLPRVSAGGPGALAAVIEAVSQIALDFPEIAEIDINPLLVEGDSPVAADALVILAPPEGRRRGRRPARGSSSRTWRRCSPRSRSPSSERRTTSASGVARPFATSWTAATPARSTR